MSKGKRNNCVWKLVVFLLSLTTIAFLVGMIILLVTRPSSCDDNTTVPSTTVSPTDPEVKWPPPSGSYFGNYSRAAVASDNGVCSEIGRNVLIDGGNAVDAAIASIFCIGVTTAHSAGLGGGLFMSVYMKDQGKCLIFDGRSKAPLASDEDSFVNQSSTLSTAGWLSVAVPGELYALRRAYEIAGSGYSWAKLVQPTIDLCNHGIIVSEALAEAISEKTDEIKNETTGLHVFFNEITGKPYVAGEIMTRKQLAKTLQQLAESPDPIDLFYNGTLAETMAEEFYEHGGNITKADFQAYLNDTMKDPLVTTIGNLSICGPPPPSSSAVVMTILNILSGYDIAELAQGSHENQLKYQSLLYHYVVEAMKFGYGGRETLGDDDASRDYAKVLISEQFADWARSNIGVESKPNASYYESDQFAVKDDHGTSHVSVIDIDGNAVSVTTSINLFFGSKRRSEKTGIIWNDDMDDFSTPGAFNIYGYPPSPANFIAPGKRPLSSMTPLIAYDNNTGEVQFVVGAAGGARIITATAQVLMRLLWFNQNAKEAVDSPRLHNQLHPYQTDYQSDFPLALLNELQGRNHKMVLVTNNTASCVVQRSGKRLYASSDYRKPGGYPAGY